MLSVERRPLSRSERTKLEAACGMDRRRGFGGRVVDGFIALVGIPLFYLAIWLAGAPQVGQPWRLLFVVVGFLWGVGCGVTILRAGMTGFEGFVTLFGGGIAATLLALFPILILRWVGVEVPQWIYPLLLSLGMSLTMRFVRSQQRHRLACKRDLTIGDVELVRVQAEGAVVVEGPEDGEQGGLFFGLGEARMLFLDTGDHLGKRPSAFPAAEFEVVLAPESRVVLSLEVTGGSLAPMRTRGPLGLSDYIPGTCEVIPGTLESLDDDLKRLKRSGNPLRNIR